MMGRHGARNRIPPLEDHASHRLRGIDGEWQLLNPRIPEETPVLSHGT
jgi:hypothetical protein